MKSHTYALEMNWEGNLGEGTKGYKAFERSHSYLGKNKRHAIAGSSDPSFLGDEHKYNPEELFIGSISSCHMLWYLHLCTTNNICVTAYSDKVSGIMKENDDGSGQFESVTLNPHIVIKEKEKVELAKELHHKAHDMCFIARSCNFTIDCKPTVFVEE